MRTVVIEIPSTANTTNVTVTGRLKELGIRVTDIVKVLGSSSEICSVSSKGSEEHSLLFSVALKIIIKPPWKSSERRGKYPSERILDKILLFFSVLCSSFQGQSGSEIATKTHFFLFARPLRTVRRKLWCFLVSAGNENIRIGVWLGETDTSYSWSRSNVKFNTWKALRANVRDSGDVDEIPSESLPAA